MARRVDQMIGVLEGNESEPPILIEQMSALALRGRRGDGVIVKQAEAIRRKHRRDGLDERSHGSRYIHHLRGQNNVVAADEERATAR